MIRKLLVTLVLFVLILSAGFFSSLYLKKALDSYFNRRTVVVPEFVGKSLSAAIRLQQTHEGNLKIQIASEVESASVPRDTVLTQDPPAGSIVNFEKTIFLTVSKGTRLREVPDVVGLDIRKARLLLSEARLKVGKKSYLKSPDRERGVVIAQYPEGRAMAGQGETVDLVLSDGRAEADMMPRVTYLKLSEAQAVLRDANVQKVNVEEVPAGTLPPDLVLAQDPPPGTPVRADGSCRLTVSKGAASGHLADTKRKVWVQFDMPPGLTNKLLEVEVTDNITTAKVYSQMHAPGDTVRLEVTGEGSLLVKFYLDQNPVPVMEQRY
jgi:beta-lactam-binding protein with PASTA domain